MLIKEQRRRKMSKKQEFPHLESISRITRLPMVESSLILASGFYTKVKCSSSLIHWGLTKAESSVHGALGRAIPAANALEKPINLLDTAMCRGLDVVEKKLPAITLPPTMLYASTKDFVSTTLVQPVLRRADSVLACKYTNLAAEKIDSALDVADKYVDQYLPKTADENTVPQNCEVDGRAVVHTIHHVDHFSRKLRRRLTQRTLLEAKALKQQSEDLLHTLIQLAELLARDPKAVKEKAMALWIELSKNEPENQARPTTLEQLLVMLTRESARRVVHLANHVSANVAKLPHYLTVAVHEVVDYTTMFTDMLLRTWQLDKTRDQVIVHARLQMLKLQWLASEINTYANQLLLILSVNINNKHSQRQSNNANSTQNNLNAVD